MKKLALVSLAAFMWISTLRAQTTAFTYQGRLGNSNGVPLTGRYDMTFAVFNAATAGAQIGSTVASNSVLVTTGYFTVTLDFGSGIFTGPDRWLQIAVKTNGAATYTNLSPRQPLTPAPYAIYAASAIPSDSSVTLNKLAPGVLDPSNFPPKSVTSAQLADVISLGRSNVNGRLDVYRTAAGTPAISLVGGANQISTFGSDGLEQTRLWGPGWGELLLFNSLPINAQAVSLSANSDFGGLLLLANSNGVTRVLVSGANSGGRVSLSDGTNEATQLNAVGNSWITGGLIGLGKGNPASPLDVAGNASFDSNIALDALNANANGSYAPGLLFGGLGSGESISSQRGTNGPSRFGLDFFTGFNKRMSIANNGSVGIGTDTPQDSLLDVEGPVRLNDYDVRLRPGTSRQAGLGYRSALTNSVATYGIDGPFLYGFNGGALGVGGPDSPALTWNYVGNVWISNNLSAISLDVRRDAISFGAQTRQMINLYNALYGIGIQASTAYFRTDGGYAWFRGGSHNDGQNNPGGGTTLMRLDSSGNLITAGTVNPPSDRHVKENFTPVNARAVLDKVASLSITRWNYTNDVEHSAHLGPVAQDFHAAFGLGTDDRHIATVDADGVALAAIQGLNQKVDAETAALREQLKRSEADNLELKRRLEKLEKLLADH